MKAAVNPFEFDASFLHPSPAAPVVAGAGPGVVATGVLGDSELAQTRAALDAQTWQPVGLDGIADHYKPGDTVGSWRATFDSQEFADALWMRLRSVVEGMPLDARTPTDHDGDAWTPVGINPRMRCIRYRPGGLLVPHYDAPYDYGDNRRRTLLTVVLYLGKTEDAVGGATRFLHDSQDELAFADRDFSDWTRLAEPQDLAQEVDGAAGSALLFWHRVLHDSEPLASGEKTIIRTDVVFERRG